MVTVPIASGRPSQQPLQKNSLGDSDNKFIAENHRSKIAAEEHIRHKREAQTKSNCSPRTVTKIVPPPILEVNQLELTPGKPETRTYETCDFRGCSKEEIKNLTISSPRTTVEFKYQVSWIADEFKEKFAEPSSAYEIAFFITTSPCPSSSEMEDTNLA
ncbi:uncharacterized protein TRIADDRAFT_62328 [Trichoplax adhaerens]|uniref:Uncharacterized protein n=1 Tax=Trichoplax adhaerens TaxID=10228 RepID=B3SDH2_TRIAD|nr:predicted protein [Trichoplax adhaerens]EDV19231.1 predicted protein [Trichoplax adhaerens]|eukprot:XP_002118297.1 predicted protein [Trichoplax adhaerens]